MRQLVLFLLAAICSAKELSSEELSKYGTEIFNDCTTCNLQNAAKEHPDLMKQITIGISMLPASLKSQAMLLIQDWAAKISQKPVSDCNKVCLDTKSIKNACSALDIVAQHISDQMLAYQADEAKKCNGKKECLDEVAVNNELIVLGVKHMVMLVSMYVDPTTSCDSPQNTQLMLLNSPTKLLGCKVCRATLEFLYTTVVGGESETSKKFINAIGDGGVKVCKYMKIDKVLGFLARFLGKNSLCEEVRGLVNVLFKKVISPFFKEKASQSCGYFFGQC